MTIITYNIPVKQTETELPSAPLCACGGKFKFNLLHSGKKGKYQGITAKCTQCNEEYYDMYEKDLVNKILRLQSKPPKR